MVGETGASLQRIVGRIVEVSSLISAIAYGFVAVAERWVLARVAPEQLTW